MTEVVISLSGTPSIRFSDFTSSNFLPSTLEDFPASNAPWPPSSLSLLVDVSAALQSTNGSILRPRRG